MLFLDRENSNLPIFLEYPQKDWPIFLYSYFRITIGAFIFSMLLLPILAQKATAQNACDPTAIAPAVGTGFVSLQFSITADGACQSSFPAGEPQVQVFAQVLDGLFGQPGVTTRISGQVITPSGTFALNGSCPTGPSSCQLRGTNPNTSATVTVLTNLTYTSGSTLLGTPASLRVATIAVTGQAFDTTRHAPVFTNLNGAGPFDIPINIEIDFGQPISGFNISDVIVSGAASVELVPEATMDTSKRVVRVTPLDGATSLQFVNGVPIPSTEVTQVTLSIPENAVTGPLGQGNLASLPLTVQFNAVPPRISLRSVTEISSGIGGEFVATFSVRPLGSFQDIETLSNFVSVENASLRAEVNSGTFVFTRSGFGPIRVTFLQGAARRAGLALVSPEVSFDIAPAISPAQPAAFLSANDTTINGATTLNVTFSEPVSGLTSAAFETTGGTVANIVGNANGDLYTVVFTPTAPAGTISTATVRLNADQVPAVTGGALNTASNAVSLSVFDDPIDVSLQSEPFGLDSYTMHISFERNVTGFSIDDLIVNGATVSSFTGSQSDYTVFVEPFSVLHEISIPSGVAEDEFGNVNLASAGAVTPPGVGPNLRISLAQDAITTAATDVVFFVFAEPVLGFDETDITVSGGTLRNFGGSGAVYSANIDIEGTRALSVAVPAGAATGASGPNQAASATLQLDSAQIAQDLISTFLTARNTALLAAQPDVTGFIRGQSGFLNGSVTRGAGQLRFHSGQDRPVWAALEADWSNTGAASSRYVLASLGAHRFISDTTLVGAMLQFDDISQTQGAATIKGQGWLIGPYWAASHPTYPLFFDARLLWGKTRNEIQPVGTFTDTFTSTRLLAQFNVAGEIETPTATWIPHLKMGYVRDKQDAYIDGLGNPVSAQSAKQAQVDLGLGFEMPLADGHTMLTGAASAIWSETDNTVTTSNSNVDGTRGRIELGLRHVGPNGLNYVFSVHHDGIGTSRYEASGFALDLSFKF